MIILELSCSGLSIYFLMVVYSYYSTLLDEEHQPIAEEG